MHWEAMLDACPNTLCFACDDTHLRPDVPGWNGGWIRVNSPTRSRESILAAIRAGNFYSTCGPEFYRLDHHDAAVTFRTSPIQLARLVGPGWRGKPVGSFEGAPFSEATLEIPQDWPYAYLEVEDAQGRRAWTNPLFRS